MRIFAIHSTFLWNANCITLSANKMLHTTQNNYSCAAPRCGPFATSQLDIRAVALRITQLIIAQVENPEWKL